MAGLLLGLLVAYFQSQRKAEIGREAQNLADGISRTSFSILSGGQKNYDLPVAVGGAPYRLIVDEDRNAVVVQVTGGSQEGAEYGSVIDAYLQVLSIPNPGEVLYITENGGKIVLSSSPLQIQEEEIPSYPSLSPPDFYYFARENQRGASALGASYFWALNHYPEEENLDVREYVWQNSDSNTLLARITSEGGPLAVVSVSGGENGADVGVVNHSWVVHRVENAKKDFDDGNSNPSIAKAYMNGWFYSRTQVVEYLQSRSWRRTDDNRAVEIPDSPEAYNAAATTNVGTYPTYLIEFKTQGENYVIHFQAMPWYYSENQAGFVFQSKPELEPIT